MVIDEDIAFDGHRDPNRLQEVERTGLLDTEPEACFDRLTDMARTLTESDVAFFAVVDANRDFYKSMKGFPGPAPREVGMDTLCRRTVAGARVLAIEDTHADQRYASVEVVQQLGVRSYLGVPVAIDGGAPFGTFCAVGFEPRAWTEQDVGVMSELGQAAAREIDMRLSLETSRRAIVDRERLLAMVAHDLRNPLSVVMGGLELLEERFGGRDEDVLAVRTAAASMGDLIGDLLKTASMEGDGLPLQRRRRSPTELVEEAWTTFRFLGARKQIMLTRTVAGSLPDVFVDDQRLIRVFANLISNAIKFSPENASIELGATHANGGVEFWVQDHGPGMDEAQQNSMFEAFWQADPNDPRGIGLGLHIVDQLVRAHGGRVSVVSAPGLGSRFSFVVPAAH